MDLNKHFLSITEEMHALKDRVRNLTPHWPTDGEWKETVIRTILRRHLPKTIEVGRGFILKGDQSTTQIDVLIYDSSYPTVHQDGDLVIVTRDAVRGIIEVKSRARTSSLPSIFQKLANNAYFVNEGMLADDIERPDLFIGLIAFDFDGPANANRNAAQVLEQVSAAVNGDCRRMINHVSLGKSDFVRFWPSSPYERNNIRAYQRWHFYQLENKAPGYFINNVVSSVATKSVDQNQETWFPREGKELHRLADRPFTPTGNRRDRDDA